MIYDITHLTSYAYGDPVDLAHHLLHLTPRALAHQSILDCEIVTAPPAARNVASLDHFGNVATVLVMDEPHKDFAVRARARVEITAPVVPGPEATQPFETVREALALGADPQAIEASEFIHASPFVALGPEIAAYARASFPPGTPILAGAIDLTRRIHHDFAYTPGTTAISTPVVEVLADRRGVCQDFAHVEIAALRVLGLAARYVSGYIRTYPRPGARAWRGADASHAWVQVWCGADGWIDVDPTNDMIIRDEHITLAIGRDFGDVSPVRGVILGGGRQSLSVAVTVTPLPGGADAADASAEPA